MQMQGLYRIRYVCLHKQTCFFGPSLQFLIFKARVTDWIGTYHSANVGDGVTLTSLDQSYSVTIATFVLHAAKAHSQGGSKRNKRLKALTRIKKIKER